MTNKGKSLFLNTDFTCEMKDVEIKNGNIIIENNTEHIVDDTPPLIYKTGLLSNQPFYICKWNTLVPIKFKTVTKKMTTEDAEKFAEDNDYYRIEYDNEKKKRKGWLRQKLKKKQKIEETKVKIPTTYEFKKLEIVDVNLDKIKITPSMLKETVDERFLKNMKKYAMGKDSEGGISKGKTIAIAIGSMVFGIVFMLIILLSSGVR